MDKPGKKLLRCAIYTRKSTEHNLDLEFNSLDAQREASLLSSLSIRPAERTRLARNRRALKHKMRCTFSLPRPPDGCPAR